jgi:DNA-directed RNA polymerase subunit RPC12/RpoP
MSGMRPAYQAPNLDLLYQCHSCGHAEIVKSYDKRTDGRTCEYCGQHTSPTGYVGIDLAKDDE